MPQGDPSAPLVFAASMDMLMHRFTSCHRRLADGKITNTAATYVQKMDATDERSWTAHKHARVCTDHHARFPDTEMKDEDDEKVPRVLGSVGFKALGTQITMNGDDCAERDNRMRLDDVLQAQKHLLPSTKQCEIPVAADGTNQEAWSLLECGFVEPTGTRREDTPSLQENGTTCTRQTLGVLLLKMGIDSRNVEERRHSF